MAQFVHGFSPARGRFAASALYAEANPRGKETRNELRRDG
jgi:hypothetical protein